MDYHNEFDPYAAQWIRNLMQSGLIPKGEVDERSIADVSAGDLRGFKRWHLFSGIGGWALALRIAGWPDDREIWTGSAPCQAFSVAGKGAGFDDPRDLWPHMFQLMRAIRPAVAMGEQVYAAVGKGWLDRVHADMEGAGYAVGSLGAPACAVNAPHRRDRLWWCAEDRSVVLDHGDHARLEGLAGNVDSSPGRREPDRSIAASSCSGDLLDSASIGRRERRTGDAAWIGHDAAIAGAGVFDSDGDDADAWGYYSWRQAGTANNGASQIDGPSNRFSGRGDIRGAWDSSVISESGADCAGDDADAECSRSLPSTYSGVHSGEESPGSRHVKSIRHRGTWDDSAWIICHDGKARRVGLSESGIRSLADDGRSWLSSPRLRTGIDAEITPLLAQGVKSRVGKLRGFGNMIVPSLAAELISAYMECRPQGTT